MLVFRKILRSNTKVFKGKSEHFSNLIKFLHSKREGGRKVVREIPPHCVVSSLKHNVTAVYNTD